MLNYRPIIYGGRSQIIVTMKLSGVKSETHFKAMALILAALLTGCAGFRKAADLPEDPHNYKLTGNTWYAGYSERSRLNYIVTLPSDYDTGSKKYPLILFLHSQAERGSNVTLLIDNQSGGSDLIAPLALKDKNFPFITISPLCPAHYGWPVLNQRVNRLLKDVTVKYRTDLSRIYITGVSMGGMGTWSVAMKHPHWFAAMAPISGGTMFPMTVMRPKRIKNIPVWAFHDRYDKTIPIKFEEKDIERLKKAGGNVRYTVTETGRHEIWTDIYNKPDIFNWLLENEKKK